MSTYTPEQLKEVLDLHGKWLRDEDGGQRANMTDANLYGANLSGANLTRADLTRADLTDADLRGADLSYADLSYANLRGANLTDANLTRANLTRADLTDADLRGADLSYADLSYANLRGANLTDAYLADADLYGADLADIRSLWGTIGNMVEIKSIQADTWPVAYTATHMHIGCQLHPLSDWWTFDDEQISDMDPKALKWWAVWKPILQTVIAASPAVPTERAE